MAINSPFEPKPFGRYVLLDKLAIGGMAEIYKAKTFGIDGFEKLLAIKRILPHCSADKEFINMLVDEAKLTVLLSHANIVQVFDLGKVGEDYFISMEFISGTNLKELMYRYNELKERLPDEIAVFVMSEVCKGLDYAHRKTDSQGNPLNIVHRDISPQNILLSYEGEVKIVDFGIAKAAMNVSHTTAGILKGKVSYMSPEQALGKPIDHRTDIFSAGVVLYEMLTGEKLFTGETQFEVLNQIRTTRVNTMMLPDKISPPLKAILAKALSYNAKDRYQNAGDFQLDLTKHLYSSYIDFSPRQLAALLLKFFQSEIKRKESPPIDEKTKAAFVTKPVHEDIVVHRPSGPVVDKVASSISRADTAVSIKTKLPPMPPSPPHQTSLEKPKNVLLILGLALILTLAGYFGYKFFFKHLKKQEPTTEKAATPENTNTDETQGSLIVESDPSGARILINGHETGQVTPGTIKQLNVGDEYQVTLLKENYQDVNKTTIINSHDPFTIHEALTPLPKGSIEIDSTPPGGHIFLNDQDTSLVTPNRIENLEIGKSYHLKLSSPNYYDWSNTVEVKDLTPIKLSASLNPVPPPAPVQPMPQVPTPAPVAPPPTPPKVEPKPVQPKARVDIKKFPTPAPPPSLPPPVAAPEPVREVITGGKPGTLSVNSDPAGAQVFINSELKGNTPLKVSNVPAGTVTVSLSKDGYMRQTDSIRLGSGEEKSLGTIRLGNLYGEVYVASSPPRADVYFDGESIGARTPVTIRRIMRDKPHTVKVKLDGYKSWETPVNLKEQENKKYDVLLEKE